MAVGQKLVMRGLDQALDEIEPRVQDAEASDHYRLNPWAHCDEGHVKILDLETLQEVEFHPWAHQIELGEEWIDLDELRAADVLRRGDFRNVHEEKSRQMGITWLLAYLVWWLMKYHEVPGVVQHMDFGEVDDGGSGSTPDSFFGKVRFINEHMPLEHKAPIDFVYGKLKHRTKPAAFVEGEAATPDSARGGGYGWMILDEAARIPWGDKVHASATRAVPTGRVYNSTPAGKSNMYYRLRQTQPKGYRFLRHHWTQHPVYARGLHVAGSLLESCKLCAGNVEGVAWNATDPKAHRYPDRPTSPWYDEAVLDLTDDDVSTELEIDYEGSRSIRVYPEFSYDVHVLPEGIEYDPAFPVEFWIDYGLDTTAVAFLQDTPWEIRVFAELEIGTQVDGRSAIPDVVGPEMIEVLADAGVPLKILTREFRLQMLGVGDPAGEGKDLSTGRPLKTDYLRHGWRIVAPRRLSKAQTINVGKRILGGRPKPIRVCGIKCKRTILHFEENKRKHDRYGNPAPGPIDPIDDEHNHMMRGYAYYCTYKYPPGRAPTDQPEPVARPPDDPERSENSSGRLSSATPRYGEGT